MSATRIGRALRPCIALCITLAFACGGRADADSPVAESGGAHSNGGTAAAQGGAGNAAFGGASTAQGGAGNAAFGGAPTAQGGAGNAANGGGQAACECAEGGAPHSLLVRGDGGDSILSYSAEPAPEELMSCGVSPLRGVILNACGLRLSVAACAGSDGSPPCLIVSRNDVTYIDRERRKWLGRIDVVTPATGPSIVDPHRLEGSFSALVRAAGAELMLSGAYVLCGYEDSRPIPC